MEAKYHPDTSGEYVERTYCHKCNNKVFEQKKSGDPCPLCGGPLKRKLFRLHTQYELERLGQKPELK